MTLPADKRVKVSDQNLLEKLKALIPQIPDRQVREMVSEFVRVLEMHVDEIATLRAQLTQSQADLEGAKKGASSIFRTLLIFINNEFTKYNRTEKEKGWNAACRSIRSEIERLSALETAKGTTHE